MNLLLNSPFEKISEAVARLREAKGKNEETLSWIDSAIRLGKGFITTLYFERILVYQHLVMEEDARPKSQKNLKKRSVALAKMEAATFVAQKYVESNKLKEWGSRVYRFLGRLYDYKGKFSKAATAYKKALPLAKYDPEYMEKGVPRWLELEGFLAYSLIMSGSVNRGLVFARKIYAKYDSNIEARALKKRDYYTWAVWKSGIPIRTINALLTKSISFNRKEIEAWLSEAEEVVNPPKKLRVWGDFGIRRDEILALKRRFREVN